MTTVSDIPSFGDRLSGPGCSPFMSQLLSDIVAIGGRSLEQEEQSLRKQSERKGETGGLLTVDLICFRPYVFLRAILPRYNAQHAFTRDGRRVGELTVRFERRNYFFVLDHWNDEPVEVLEVALDRLSGRKGESYLIVSSANRFGATEERQRLVAALDGVAAEVMGEYRFPAATANGEELEFWVAAWRAARNGSDRRADP